MDAEIAGHYGSDNLGNRISQALVQAGKDPVKLSLKDIAVIDQLHTGGHLATLALVKKTGLTPGMTVLDAGCGIGGTSRLLAETIGCRVIGLDLVQTFIDVARMLTLATRQEDTITFIQGNVCAMPIDDDSVDCVWSQHTLMNIQDKPGVFKEFLRVLKPGGILVLHEVTRGSNGDIHFPVPWADRREISFLDPWTQTRDYLNKAGFILVSENDATAQAKDWWIKVKAASEKLAADPKPLGSHIIFGDNGKQFGTTMTANLDKDCIRLMEAIYKTPD
ncbi:MAG: class I SAM-dependent methyltransferase [Pseudomonadota bacterium]